MNSFLNYIADINRIHWGGSNYQWFFYLGIILVLAFEKRQMVRIVFGWVPLAYLLLTFNPLSIKLMNMAVEGVNTHQYMVRMFSFMPLMYTIARGVSVLISRIKGFAKMLVVMAVCGIFVYTGRGIFNESWYEPAKNHAKVPVDALEIAEMVKDRQYKNVSIATFNPTANYLRQVTDVITPYARNVGVLGQMLAEDPPDVQAVMEDAGGYDIDFITVHRTETTVQAFADAGYTPDALTTNLAIYNVSGVTRYKRTWNEKRQMTSITVIDADGNPVPRAEGYTTVAYDYDDKGFWSSVHYLDAGLNPCEINEGYSTMCRTTSNTGLTSTLSYFNSDGQPVLVGGRYSSKYIYDSYGRPVKELYFDAAGEPMNRTDAGYAACTRTYNHRGDITSERYLDLDGNSVISTAGFAEYRREYNEEQKAVRQCFYGTEGQLIPVNGVAIMYQIYDNEGHNIEEAYFGIDGEPVLNQISRYHKIIRTYTDNGQLSSEAWFGVYGEPLPDADGHIGRHIIYDDEGRIVSETFEYMLEH